MNDGQTVVILGGGVGGVVAATTLRKQLPEKHRVVLVDRERDHLFAPSLLWLMIGRRTADKITRPLSKLARKGIEVVLGEIDRIDPHTRTVRVVDPATGEGNEIVADHLVVSLGADLAPGIIPGLADAGHSFYTLAGAESLRDALAMFTGGKIVVLTATPAYKCPAAPYEAAMLINDDIRRRGLSEATTVDVYAAEPGPLGVAGPDVSAGVRGMVEDLAITYHPEHQVVSVDGGRLTFANGVTAEFDLLAYVPPHRVPDVIRRAGLADEGGWIKVDRGTLETGRPGVYAIGDVTGIPLTMGKPLPKAGVFAEREAKVVAQNIAFEITGQGAKTAFDGHGECFVETGGGKAGFGRGNFYGEPFPDVKLHRVGRRWHIGKLLFEKGWFRNWF